MLKGDAFVHALAYHLDEVSVGLSHVDSFPEKLLQCRLLRRHPFGFASQKDLRRIEEGIFQEVTDLAVISVSQVRIRMPFQTELFHHDGPLVVHLDVKVVLMGIFNYASDYVLIQIVFIDLHTVHGVDHQGAVIADGHIGGSYGFGNAAGGFDRSSCGNGEKHSVFNSSSYIFFCFLRHQAFSRKKGMVQISGYEFKHDIL